MSIDFISPFVEEVDSYPHMTEEGGARWIGIGSKIGDPCPKIPGPFRGWRRIDEDHRVDISIFVRVVILKIRRRIRAAIHHVLGGDAREIIPVTCHFLHGEGNLQNVGDFPIKGKLAEAALRIEFGDGIIILPFACRQILLKEGFSNPR